MRTRHIAAIATAILMVGLMSLPAVAAEEEGFGNNLSVPLLWAEGYGVTGYPIATDTGIRGDPYPAAVLTDATPYTVDGVDYDLYLQNTVNEWQAWTNDKSGTPTALGASIKWGDNLMSHSFAVGRKIRAEQQLWRTLATAQPAYEMILAEGEKRNEIWGTTGQVVPTTAGFVFSPNAQLTIWKIRPNGTRVKVPVFRGAVWEGFVKEGPSTYGVEVTKGGQVTYGYQFQPQLPGWYRLVFKLLPEVSYTLTPEGSEAVDYTVERHTKLLGVAFSTEEEGEDPQFVPYLKDRYTSILEIYVKA